MKKCWIWEKVRSSPSTSFLKAYSYIFLSFCYFLKSCRCCYWVILSMSDWLRPWFDANFWDGVRSSSSRITDWEGLEVSFIGVLQIEVLLMKSATLSMRVVGFGLSARGSRGMGLQASNLKKAGHTVQSSLVGSNASASS
jgi:hypothetical protein